MGHFISLLNIIYTTLVVDVSGNMHENIAVVAGLHDINQPNNVNSSPTCYDNL